MSTEEKAHLHGGTPRSLAARAAVVAIMTLALLLLAELIARSATWSPEVPEQTPLHLRFSEESVGDWLPSQRGVSLSRLEAPFFVAINDGGFRNLDDLDSSAVRVLVLGDSQTFGQYVSSHDVWSRVAQRQWNDQHSRRAQLLNNGIPGTTIVDHLAYLNEKVRRLSPAVVLLAVYDNDVTDMRQGSTGRVISWLAKSVNRFPSGTMCPFSIFVKPTHRMPNTTSIDWILSGLALVIRRIHISRASGTGLPAPLSRDSSIPCCPPMPGRSRDAKAKRLLILCPG